MSLPLPTDNPFLSKDYIIYETNTIWGGCKNSANISTSKIRRVFDPKLTDQSYKEIGPISYKEVEEYIATQLMDLYAKVKLAKQCDDYGIAMNTNTSIVFPTECNAMFTNFSNANIEQTRYNIKLGNGSKYTTQLLPTDEFSRFFYTTDYINANQTSKNAQKPICQRMSDLVQMLTDIDTILKNMNTNNVKQKYPDQHSAIVQKVNANKRIRTELDGKLREIYAGNGSRFENSKLYLDSTVYTTVLWTILATTLLYYCFRKL
jgi:hypothetical protein